MPDWSEQIETVLELNGYEIIHERNGHIRGEKWFGDDLIWATSTPTIEIITFGVTLTEKALQPELRTHDHIAIDTAHSRSADHAAEIRDIETTLLACAAKIREVID